MLRDADVTAIKYLKIWPVVTHSSAVVECIPFKILLWRYPRQALLKIRVNYRKAVKVSRQTPVSV